MSHMIRFVFAILTLAFTVGAVADDAEPDSETVAAEARTNGKSTRTKPQLAVTPEREAAVLEFLRQHHPELLHLVVYLRDNLPKEYQKAIRDLYRTHERLTGIVDRGDLKRHELELKFWKTQSRIHLLTARYRMSKSKEIEKQLQSLLNEQIDLRIMMLRYNRERIEARLQKLDQQIEDLQAARQQRIERQMQSLTKSDKPAFLKKNDGPSQRVRTQKPSPPGKSSPN